MAMTSILKERFLKHFLGIASSPAPAYMLFITHSADPGAEGVNNADAQLTAVGFTYSATAPSMLNDQFQVGSPITTGARYWSLRDPAGYSLITGRTLTCNVTGPYVTARWTYWQLDGGTAGVIADGAASGVYTGTGASSTGPTIEQPATTDVAATVATEATAAIADDTLYVYAQGVASAGCTPQAQPTTYAGLEVALGYQTFISTYLEVLAAR